MQEVTGARSEFYEAYKRQAKIFDKELKEYNKELNVTLLFVSDTQKPVTCIKLSETSDANFFFQAALFAVVTSTFLRWEESKRLLLSWENEQGVYLTKFP